MHGLPNMAPDGFKIPFAAGHTRRMPRLTAAPVPLQGARRPLPRGRAALREAPGEAGRDLALGAEPAVSGRGDRRLFARAVHRGPARRARRRGPPLPRRRARTRCRSTSPRGASRSSSIPPGTLLASFIDLNNLALARFSAEERKRIGVHTCPGGDRDSTHSADVDYAELLPSLFQLNVTNFYVALAGEKDRRRVLKIIREHLKPDQRIFVGVVVAHRPAHRDRRGGPRPRPRGRRVHPARRSSAPPTTAASRRSATTPRPSATRRSPRSARGSAAPRSPRHDPAGRADGDRRRGASCCARSRCRTCRASSRARAARRAGAPQDQGGARGRDAHPRAAQPDRARCSPRSSTCEARRAGRHRRRRPS